MTLVPSFASLGSPSSLSSSPSGSVSSQIPSDLHPTLSLIERRDEARRQDRLHELANAVREMETLIQKTHAASARVTAAFAAAAVAEGLSPIAGHQFVSQVSRVTMHTSDALSHSADAHRLLRRLGTSLGYDVTAFGDTACPDDEMFVGPMGQTKRVAA